MGSQGSQQALGHKEQFLNFYTEGLAPAQMIVGRNFIPRSMGGEEDVLVAEAS